MSTKRMKAGAVYRVTRKIKTHTSPLREVTYDEVGRFKKETSKMFIFDSFKVKKSTIICINLVEND